MEPPIAVQILIERKGADPSATTAREAIRDLLGLGASLLDLKRRRLLELAVEVTERVHSSGEVDSSDRVRPTSRTDALAETVARYLDRTTLLWNPNKERAWVRLSGADRLGSFEMVSGTARASRFGHPSLEEEQFDHVLVWNQDRGSGPRDLAAGVAPHRLLGSGSAELWSAQWLEGASSQERRALTASISEVRSRRQGFLVNPHYQDHRIIAGAVPLPLWGNPE